MRRRLLSVVSALATITTLFACGEVDPSANDGPKQFADATAEASTDASGDVSAEPAESDAPADASEPPCFVGDLAVYTTSDAAPLESITCIRGSLTIDTTSLVALPRLREVAGSVVLESASPAFVLPSLETVGADLRVDGEGTATLSLPLLREVAGKLVVVDARIASIDAPQLESVAAVEVVRATWLKNLSLPSLRNINGDAVFFLSGLTEVALPNLERIEGALRVESMVGLTSVSLPRLREVVGAIDFSFLQDVSSLILPALERAGSFGVDSPNHHQTLSLPKLTNVGSVSIDAPALTLLSLPSLVECEKLTVRDVALTELRLPELRKSTGQILLAPLASGAPFLSSVEFPKLEEVQSLRLTQLQQLVSLDVPQLRIVKNELLLAHDPHLTELSLPSLTSLGDLNVHLLATIASVSAPVLSGSASTVVTLAENPMLTGISFPVLTKLELLEVMELERLTTLSLPVAATAKTIALGQLRALTSVSLSALKSAYYITLSDVPILTGMDVVQLTSLNVLAIRDAPLFADLGRLATVPTSLQRLELTNTGLDSARFPNLLDTDAMWISDNSVLTALSFPLLQHVSNAFVRYCPKLPQCEVDAINASLLTGSISTRDLAVCAP